MVTPTGQTAAQAAAQGATGRSVSNEQIAEALRNSGMSLGQVRERLRAAGYDTTLADPFFASGRPSAPSSAAGQPGTAAAGLGSSEFASALQALGMLSAVGAENAAADTLRRVATASPPERTARVFGKDIFNRSATVFDPITSGPVDPAYRLGVGDQVQVVVTGQVELAYALELRRDGTVIVPQVGQIALAGLTLDGARGLLRERMGRSYSGLNTGEARLDLSISRIRSNAVFVIGEVEVPGAYQVNALATVFHAIARAGGPTDRGSFRNVEVRRGNRVIERLDLYEYLLRGDASGDIRLEQGDVIFVPLNTRAVSVTGQVRRPRVFELRENEGFSDLLRFAGGLTPEAATERIQIDRILPPSQRAPGVERVKVDVEVKGSLDSLARVPLLDGDVVEVFGIGPTRRNVVDIAGQVWAPGQYQWKPGKTLGQLVDEAQGLMPWALADRIKVVRQQPLTGGTTVQNVDASRAAGRAYRLEEFDAVEVLDARLAYASGIISVQGAVNLAGTRQYSEGETLRDAIERSGGVREDAQVVELYRRRVGPTYSDTTSERFTYRLSA
ncbi:MAG: SLBB domain-containing protein, partial [Gemmatimonadota bacterium]|nr:SLBB domain-containing protein [Gemmatimonadota bacterium]